MQQLNHHDYYVTRARVSRQLAERAASPSIAAIHADLASRYERTVEELAQAPNSARQR